MGLSFKKETIPAMEVGTYGGRLLSIVGIGMQANPSFSIYPEKPPSEKVILTVEFPGELITLGGEQKPRVLSETLNLFTTERATLTKRMNVFDPSGNDRETPQVLLGRPCMVEVGLTSGGKPKVTGLTGCPNGFNVLELVSNPFVFDFYSPEATTYNGLQGWVKEKIRNAEDFLGSECAQMIHDIGGDAEEDYSPFHPSTTEEDDVPF